MSGLFKNAESVLLETIIYPNLALFCLGNINTELGRVCGAGTD